jgi:hypothetical protein
MRCQPRGLAGTIRARRLPRRRIPAVVRRTIAEIIGPRTQEPTSPDGSS